MFKIQRISEKIKSFFTLLELVIQVCFPLLCVMLFAIFWSESGYAFIALIPPFILVWCSFFSQRQAVKLKINRKIWEDTMYRLFNGGTVTAILTFFAGFFLIYTFSVNLMYIDIETILLLCFSPVLYTFWLYKKNIAKRTTIGTIARSVFAALIIAIIYAIIVLFAVKASNGETTQYYAYRMSESEWLEYYSAFIQLGIFIKVNLLNIIKDYSWSLFSIIFFILNVINAFSLAFGIILMTDRLLLLREKDRDNHSKQNNKSDSLKTNDKVSDAEVSEVSKVRKTTYAVITLLIVVLIGWYTDKKVQNNTNIYEKKSKFTIEKIQKIFGITQDPMKKLQDELSKVEDKVNNLNLELKEKNNEIEKLRLENAKIKKAKRNACIDPVADFLKTSQLEQTILESENNIDETKVNVKEENNQKEILEEKKNILQNIPEIDVLKEKTQEIKDQVEQKVEESKEIINEGIEEVKNRGMWEAVKAWFSGWF